MKIYYITSDYHSAPLAVIATDGRTVQFQFDSTDGKLPKTVGGRFERLKEIVNKSSHMKMSEPRDTTVGLLRYVLENGDVVEVTSDGKSALLNGKLLQQEEKDALMQAIANGGLKVVRRADINKPTPILPTPRVMKKPEPRPELNPAYKKALMESNKKADEQSYLDSSDHDSQIENMQFEGSLDGGAFGRAIMYQLKYGKAKGEQ